MHIFFKSDIVRARTFGYKPQACEGHAVESMFESRFTQRSRVVPTGQGMKISKF